MNIYIVVREFQDGAIQNEFTHTSITKAKKFIKNDNWDGNELYIEVWNNGIKTHHILDLENYISIE